MSVSIKHIRYIRYITLMIPLFLVFMGMKVPDLSRPHKPRPMRAAVLDKTPVQTVMQSITKIDIDPVITNQFALVFLAAEKYSPAPPTSHPFIPFLPLSPLPARAPPTNNHQA